MPYTLTVNGRTAAVDAPADMPLLWALRDLLDLKGTKYGCGIGACGACTVHIDGKPARACQTRLSAAVGKVADWHPANAEERALFAEAAAYCEKQGSSIAKLAFQFACQNTPFHTTMFSTARTASRQRNLEWYGEPCDTGLLSEVKRILAPVIDKQWDYDAGVEKLDK